MTTHPVQTILPPRSLVALDLAELWRYRELAYFLVWRDIKVRYKQTLLGATWAVAQPFLTMIVFSIIFGQLAKIPSDGVPYPLFSFAALVPWTYFASGLASASNSLVANSNLVRKIYFPRLLIPCASVLVSVPDFLIAFATLIVLMLIYALQPAQLSLAHYLNGGFDLLPVAAFTVNWIGLVLIVPFFLLITITSLGVGLWLATLNAQYRDVRYIVPFMVQFWFYITPIAYSSSLLQQPWRTLYGLNPMVGVIDGFRWALLGSGSPPGSMVLVSALAALVIFVTGLLYFQSHERALADIL